MITEHEKNRFPGTWIAALTGFLATLWPRWSGPRAKDDLPPGARLSANELIVRTSGVTAVLRGEEPPEPDYLLVRTTGVSAVFRGQGEVARLRPGDLVVVEAGQTIPRDGEVVEGVASVDESPLNGVSSSVLCEAGGAHGTVLAGSVVLTGCLTVRVTAGSPLRCATSQTAGTSQHH